MRVEDLNKQVVVPQTQYLQAVGQFVNNKKEGKPDSVTTTYFLPSMVFPNRVELLSVTLLHKCSDSHTHKLVDKKLYLSVQQKDGCVVISEKFTLIHPPKKLITTLTFPHSILLDKHQPFYFYHDGEMVDSAITLAYRNYD
jgi:hypothetical protein